MKCQPKIDHTERQQMCKHQARMSEVMCCELIVLNLLNSIDHICLPCLFYINRNRVHGSQADMTFAVSEIVNALCSLLAWSVDDGH